jgi:hypothetical protein
MSEPTEANNPTNAENNPTKQSKSTPPQANSPSNSQADPNIVDPRELVYAGGYVGDPREIVENPAVAPDMVEAAPEDLRDDLMPKEKDDDEVSAG